MSEQKPTVGRIVHFKVSENIVRPAIITRVWNGDCVNLAVFLDGTNDGANVDWEKAFCLKTPEENMSGGYMACWWVTSVVKGDRVGQWK